MTHQQLNEQLPSIIENLVGSLGGEPGLAHLNRVYLPSKETIIEAIKRLRQLVFPGYFGEQGLTPSNISHRIGELVLEVSDLLYQQVRCCLRYSKDIPGANGNGEACKECDTKAAEIVHTFLTRIVDVRAMLASDVAAAFEGDPAAQSADETIFCYPGLFAITVQRLAHEFFKLGVPLLPRIMTEHAHSETGIDIHPGAKLGKSFFIDHGTGVVIGETTEIGSNVKVQNNVSIYEGVELEDDVFCGPSMVFTNVLNPRAHVSRKHEYRKTLVRRGATIGANATIVCGTTLGEYAFVGAGAVIADDVQDYALMVGVPARRIGWMCQCGERLPDSGEGTCAVCGSTYVPTADGIRRTGGPRCARPPRS